MLETVAYSIPWIGLIVGYGILTHGIILLNDGLYWDGWMLDVWQENKDWKSMRRFFSEVGMRNLYFEHRILGYFPKRRSVYRAVSLASILIAALAVFLMLVHTGTFTPPQATAIALLFVSYPAYAVTFESNVSLQYTFKIALFYVACFLAVTTIAEIDSGNIAIFAGSLVLFFAAFNANSLLAYFWGFVLFYGWLAYSRGAGSLASATACRSFMPATM